ncbi:diguanylate cyclase (GGDEF)-like protein/PAS domain S-box-containing protein [Anaerosolibacter carboniphilus]|uniref:Diguanylate cyclase (GGDEF)-like protein/PAS domain S-box-containing protein n=1 Tax=Anaerosolibacter carboniphilus TaxID=1417629 RepID=A0A841KKP0_9FIRM|nr:GGDEF domain-containing phosphodiesterase [Anaerosolibacter carboniphilus]MBB6213973.1 diguanylate cyclase (GGDEF)-like protein/PAS domain S-box-containing protein [Anaerosolibacter carboniphilus]
MNKANKKKLKRQTQSNNTDHKADEPDRPLELHKKPKLTLVPLKIALLYLIIGGIWIILSDEILSQLFTHIETLTIIQTLKGWLFILITGAMIYFMIGNSLKKGDYWSEKLIQSYEELEAVHGQLMATEEALKEKYSALLKSEIALKDSEERYRLALEGTSDGIWVHDTTKEENFVFNRTKEILGYEEDEMPNTLESWQSIIHPEDIVETMEIRSKYLSRMIPSYEHEYRLRAKTGEYRWIASRGKAVWDEHGNPVRMIGSHKDITNQKLAEEKIYRLAYYDSLTDLPNRVVFDESLSTVLEEAKAKREMTALLYLDLDNFKMVNDTLGHIFGDLLLKNVGELLKRCLDERGIVARVGGDEFCILLSSINSKEEVIPVVEKVLAAFQNPWILDDREFYITTSIGIAAYPLDGEDRHTLLRNADTAMYGAKDYGKNNYRFYTVDMNKKIVEKLEMSNSLRRALERKELLLYYQPQVDLEKGKIVGVEALVRWNHPIWGMVSPVKFIPIAEETGMIMAIGEWVLREACSQSKKWREAGYPSIGFGVNLSAQQFQQQDLVEMIHSIILENELEPQHLELEITESLAMKDLEHTVDILKRLRSLGIKIALDDFGTGYSSLNYLKQLPIDTLKIDKSFVNDITMGSNEEAIAKSLITLAHSMSLIVTAEGIETKDQYMFLQEQCCDKAQGYLFSKPLPPDALERLLVEESVGLT